MGIGGGTPSSHKDGPKVMHSKDLCPSNIKTVDGVWREFQNVWTTFKSNMPSDASEWRSILERLHEYSNNVITDSDLGCLLGTDDVSAQRTF